MRKQYSMYDAKFRKTRKIENAKSVKCETIEGCFQFTRMFQKRFPHLTICDMYHAGWYTIGTKGIMPFGE